MEIGPFLENCFKNNFVSGIKAKKKYSRTVVAANKHLLFVQKWNFEFSLFFFNKINKYWKNEKQIKVASRTNFELLVYFLNMEIGSEVFPKIILFQGKKANKLFRNHNRCKRTPPVCSKMELCISIFSLAK